MDLGEILWAPIKELIDPSFRMAYLYLFSSFVVATVVYMIEMTRRGQAERVSLLRWLLPKSLIAHPSTQVDVAYYVINKILLALIFGSILLTAPLAFDGTLAALEGLFGPSTADIAPHWGWSVLTTLAIVVVLDFVLWFLHYIFHKVPFLWDYHKVHHSAEMMTPLTAARMHPVEEVPSSLCAGLAIGATYAVLFYLLGDAAIHLRLFEINIILAVFFFAAFHLRHSHVWVRYPVWLQHILVCPAQHQIHHSVERRHWDKNMGFIFAFWDWAAGTLYAPKEREHLTFGLGTHEDGGTWHSLGALYTLPFKQSWARLRSRGAAPTAEPLPADRSD
jgi:sterol desaturase/sphingolipid hydroxylase (fatty acid hydroxylase superfamily)